jgi:hypothetical protein
VVLQIVYDAYGEEPPLLGARHVLVLPEKAPSIEAWYQATARFREPPHRAAHTAQPPGGPRTRQGDDTQKG